MEIATFCLASASRVIRGSLNWGITEVRLACDKSWGVSLLLIHVGEPPPGQMSLVCSRKQAMRQLSPMVPASVPAGVAILTSLP